MKPEIKPAKGTRGCLLWDGDHYFFRVYEANKEFTDYDIRHNDLFVTIDDEDAVLYKDNNEFVLDHSPETLGRK